MKMCKKKKKNKGKENRPRLSPAYPYYRYDHEMYCSFMKNLMNSLEIRKFREGEIIANEMEECLEVMFMVKGRYDVGYEINNKMFFRRQFGQSTNIGGF